MYPGISTLVFSKARLAAAQIRTIGAAGFKAVEVYGVPPHFDCSCESQLKEAAAFLREEGMRVSAVHSLYIDPNIAKGRGHWINITDGAPEMVSKALAFARSGIRAAVVLGAPVVVAHAGVYGDRLTGEAVSNAASFLAAVCEELMEAGVTLALENVATEISDSGFMPQFLEKYGFPNVGICIDTGHANISDDPARAIAKAGGKLVHIHLSDNNGVADEHLVPFQGGIDWKTVVAALRNTGYSGCFNFEPKENDEPERIVRECRDAYDRLIQF
jgi:sugar phosphate isomerase/epimerase